MEITLCKKHKEQVEQAGDGVELGTCSECGQTIQYDGSKAPVLTKLGRIGDKLVLPTNPGYTLLLDSKDKEDLESVDKAPPVLGEVPPKPKTGGMHAVKQYYEENKDTILHDLDTLGEEAMCKRWWNMSQVTFLTLMARWRPEYVGLPRWAIEKGKGIKTARPRRKTRRSLTKYLNEHRQAIIQDYQALTLKEFYAKWHITSKRWTQLKKEWEVPGKLGSREKLKQPPPSNAKGLPEFPLFNDKWKPSVQEKWLETYLELSKIIGRAVNVCPLAMAKITLDR